MTRNEMIAKILLTNCEDKEVAKDYIERYLKQEEKRNDTRKANQA